MGVLVSRPLRWLAGLSATLAVLFAMGRWSAVGVLTTLTPGPPPRAGLTFDAEHGLQLDLYSPRRSTRKADVAPIVVFFYGGRWSSGQRGDYGFVGKALAQRGWVAVVPDYRLYPTARFPQFLDDCAHAVAWARQHAREFGGDPDRVVLMGHSAGAYNAAMLGLQPQRLGSVGTPPWLRGVVGLAGPYDFLPITDPVLQSVFGPRERWPDTQPVNHVGGGAPPMLLLHGSADTTVKPRNSAALATRLGAAGDTVEQVVLPGLDHVWPVAALAAPLRWRAPVLDRIDSFVRRVTSATAHQAEL